MLCLREKRLSKALDMSFGKLTTRRGSGLVGVPVESGIVVRHGYCGNSRLGKDAYCDPGDVQLCDFWLLPKDHRVFEAEGPEDSCESMKSQQRWALSRFNK
jgi:hypothetical protein